MPTTVVPTLKLKVWKSNSGEWYNEYQHKKCKIKDHTEMCIAIIPDSMEHDE